MIDTVVKLWPVITPSLGIAFWSVFGKRIIARFGTPRAPRLSRSERADQIAAQSLAAARAEITTLTMERIVSLENENKRLRDEVAEARRSERTAWRQTRNGKEFT